jgi:hypothetical protein
VTLPGGNLVIAGVAGLAFFWLTDPQTGVAAWTAMDVTRDAINRTTPGTLVGFVGSALVLLVGAWLSTRRTT